MTISRILQHTVPDRVLVRETGFGCGADEKRERGGSDVDRQRTEGRVRPRALPIGDPRGRSVWVARGGMGLLPSEEYPFSQRGCRASGGLR